MVREFDDDWRVCHMVVDLHQQHRSSEDLIDHKKFWVGQLPGQPILEMTMLLSSIPRQRHQKLMIGAVNQRLLSRNVTLINLKLVAAWSLVKRVHWGQELLIRIQCEECLMTIKKRVKRPYKLVKMHEKPSVKSTSQRYPWGQCNPPSPNRSRNDFNNQRVKKKRTDLWMVRKQKESSRCHSTRAVSTATMGRPPTVEVRQRVQWQGCMLSIWNKNRKLRMNTIILMKLLKLEKNSSIIRLKLSSIIIL